MKPAAVTKAEDSLRRAKDALAKLGDLDGRADASSAKETLDTWSDFLIYANRVYSALEHGAKVGPAKDWYAETKRQRQSDPLQSYCREARNQDDHGLEPIADPSVYEQAVQMSRGGHGKPFALMVFDEAGRTKDVNLVPLNGAKRTTVWALKDLSDRNNNFPVPREHLGQPIDHVRPYSVAAALVPTLERLIDEARGLLSADPG